MDTLWPAKTWSGLPMAQGGPQRDAAASATPLQAESRGYVTVKGAMPSGVRATFAGQIPTSAAMDTAGMKAARAFRPALGTGYAGPVSV